MLEPVSSGTPIQVSQSADQMLKEGLSFRARKNKTLISDDGMAMFLGYAKEKKLDPEITLDRLMDDAEVKYLKEDGWVLINKEKMNTLLGYEKSAVDNNNQPVELSAAKIPASPIRNSAFVPTAAESRSYSLPKALEKAEQNTELSSRQFIRFLKEKNSEQIFSAVRTMRVLGKDVPAFIKAVIYDLDQVLRARSEGLSGIIDPEIKSATDGWSDENLEAVITILLSIVDQSYKNSITGIKLAVLRVLDLK